jgi:hypothetical protein
MRTTYRPAIGPLPNGAAAKFCHNASAAVSSSFLSLVSSPCVFRSICSLFVLSFQLAVWSLPLRASRRLTLTMMASSHSPMRRVSSRWTWPFSTNSVPWHGRVRRSMPTFVSPRSKCRPRLRRFGYSWVFPCSAPALLHCRACQC